MRDEFLPDQHRFVVHFPEFIPQIYLDDFERRILERERSGHVLPRDLHVHRHELHPFFVCTSSFVCDMHRVLQKQTTTQSRNKITKTENSSANLLSRLCASRQ